MIENFSEVTAVPRTSTNHFQNNVHTGIYTGTGLKYDAGIAKGSKCFIKPVKTKEDAMRETIGQEMLRLLDPYYPKTSWMQNGEGNFFVISEALPASAQQLTTVNPEEFRAGVLSGKITGLARAMVNMFLVAENDAREDNFFLVLDDRGGFRVVKIDGDQILAYLPQVVEKYAGNSADFYKIVPEIFNLLPLIVTYHPYNWFDYIRDYLRGKNQLLSMEMRFNPLFLREKEQAIAAIGELDPQKIKQLSMAVTGDAEVAKGYYESLMDRQKKIITLKLCDEKSASRAITKTVEPLSLSDKPSKKEILDDIKKKSKPIEKPSEDKAEPIVKKKIIFFNLSFDGLMTYDCGVGTFNQNMFTCMALHNQSATSSHIIPYLVSPEFSTSIHEFDEALFTKNKEFCRTQGGAMLLLPIPDPLDHFGNPVQWKILSESAASAIINVIQAQDLRDCEQIVVIAHDVAFAQAPLYLHKMLKDKKIDLPVALNCGWIPHSTGRIMRNAQVASPEDGVVTRDIWEKTALKGARTYNYQIIPIGNHMRQHLVVDFAVDSSLFKTFFSGIVRKNYLTPLRPIRPASTAVSDSKTVAADEVTDLIIPELKTRGVPLDKDIVFSIGRGTHVKGHDLVLKSFAQVAKKNPDIHLILIAPVNQQGGRKYADSLKALVEEQGIKDKVTLITTFETELPRYVYRYPKTKVTFLLTRVSPEDLIPMEARVKSSAVLIVSNRGSNPFQVSNGVDGFVADIGEDDTSETIDDAVAKLTQALALTPEQHSAMRQAGAQKVATLYDAEKNFVENFLHFSTIPFENTVVIGAGMTGLAYSLASNHSALVLEQETYPGGICTSYYAVPGSSEKHPAPPGDAKLCFELSHGGGHFLFGSKELPQAFSVLSEKTTFSTYQRKSTVDFRHLGAAYLPYPYQYFLHQLPRQLREEVLADMEQAWQKKPPSVLTQQQWLQHYFGSGRGYEIFAGPFHEKYLAGYSGKIAALDPYKTPFDPALVREGAKFGQKSSVSAGYNANYQYPDRGLDSMAKSLAQGARIKYAAKVVAIDARNKVITLADGSKQRYHRLVSTLPLKKTLALAHIAVSEPEPPAISVLVLNIVAKKGIHCPDSDWVYMPDPKLPFHRIGFYSNVSKNFIVGSKEDQEQYISMYIERSFTEGATLSASEMDLYKAAVVSILEDWEYIMPGSLLVNSDSYIEYAYTPLLPGSQYVPHAHQATVALDISCVGRYAEWRFGGMLKSFADGLATAICDHPQQAVQHFGVKRALDIVTEAFGAKRAEKLAKDPLFVQAKGLSATPEKDVKATAKALRRLGVIVTGVNSAPQEIPAQNIKTSSQLVAASSGPTTDFFVRLQPPVIVPKIKASLEKTGVKESDSDSKEPIKLVSRL